MIKVILFFTTYLWLIEQIPLLISSMNPCPCEYYSDENNNCQCTPEQIKNYIKNIRTITR
ncbi:MAG: ATP-binding protein [Eubacteriaceae bacterium]